MKNNLHWHHIRFKLLNEIDKKDRLRTSMVCPDSPLHYMIAREVCAPLLIDYDDEIVSWRFHRMQLRKKFKNIYPQHHFKLKIYCNSGVFREKMIPFVNENEIVSKLRFEDFITGIFYERSDSYDIKDDFDERYPLSVREVWPFYMCGVSRAWLLMVESFYSKEVVKKFGATLDFWGRLKLYRRVSEEMALVWKSWAYPAFLHHLNAVFGYRWMDVSVPSKRVMMYKEGKDKLWTREPLEKFLKLKKLKKVLLSVEF